MMRRLSRRPPAQVFCVHGVPREPGRVCVQCSPPPRRLHLVAAAGPSDPILLPRRPVSPVRRPRPVPTRVGGGAA